MYTDEEAKEYTTHIRHVSGTSLLQCWRWHENDIEHCFKVLRYLRTYCDSGIFGKEVVVDFGCGTGQWLHLLGMCTNSSKLIGINLFKSQIELSKDCQLDLRQGDIRDKPPVEFNYAWCNYTLGHLTDEEVVDFLTYLRETNGGRYLLVIDLAPNDVTVDTVFDYKLRTPNTLEALCNKAAVSLQRTEFMTEWFIPQRIANALGQEAVETFLKYTTPVIYKINLWR